MTKVCFQCNKELDIECFYFIFCEINGTKTTDKCKSCYKKPERDKLKLTHKNCTKCGKLKKINIDNFPEITNARTGKKYFEGRCKICAAEYQKSYKKENKEELNEKDKEYKKEYLKRPEVKKRRNELARNQSKKQSHKDKKKQRLANDPQYKIRHRISTRIYQELKKKGSSKQGKSILNFLPYTIAELKLHLERLFEPWMNWDNWGIYLPEKWIDEDQSSWKWNIDHVIPHSHFSYISMEDEDFLKCWDLSNLRPLSAKQNILDNDRT